MCKSLNRKEHSGEKEPQKDQWDCKLGTGRKKLRVAARDGEGVQHTHSAFKMKQALNVKFTLNFEDSA